MTTNVELKSDKIILESVHLFQGKRPVLCDVNISFFKKEITVIFGENGAGKTTLLYALSRQIDVESGKIFLEGSIVSFAPDSFLLWKNLKVGELFNFFKLKNSQKNWIDFLESFLMVEQFRGEFFHRLSFGQKKRVQTFFCLMNKPDFILFDEPFSGLDFFQKKNFLKFFPELKKEVGVILTVHEVEVLKKIADQIVVIKSNKIETFKNNEYDFHEYIK